MIGNILGVMQGMKTEGDSFRNRARGTETVLWGLKIILQIWRLGGHFCRAHGASASPPPTTHKQKCPSVRLEYAHLSNRKIEFIV